jgi:hypothetical protein
MTAAERRKIGQHEASARRAARRKAERAQRRAAGPVPVCIVCGIELELPPTGLAPKRCAEHRREHRRQMQITSRAAVVDSPAAFTARQARLHNVSLEWLLWAKSFGCWACGAQGKLSVDHDHRHCAGGYGCRLCVRGVLCRGCNVALGNSHDSVVRLKALIVYLTTLRPVEVGYAPDRTYSRRVNNRAWTFNVTPRWVASAQQAGCGACGDTARPHIDHSHDCCPTTSARRACGECVRGVLCNSCSLTAGNVGDNAVRLDLLVHYIEMWEATLTCRLAA